MYRSEENIPNSEQLVQPGGPTKALRNNNERNPRFSRWLDCMDKFADEIQNVEVPPTDNVVLKNKIKVALIDDGADPYLESLRGKIVGGESLWEAKYMAGLVAHAVGGAPRQLTFLL